MFKILIEPVTMNKFYLSQFAEQLRDARQPFCRALEVSVLQYQLNKLRVPSAHSLLQDWTQTICTFSGCVLFIHVELQNQDRQLTGPALGVAVCGI